MSNLDLDSPISAWSNINQKGFKTESSQNIDMEFSFKLINRNSEKDMWRVMGLLIYKLEKHMNINNLSIYLDQIKLNIFPKDHQS